MRLALCTQSTHARNVEFDYRHEKKDEPKQRENIESSLVDLVRHRVEEVNGTAPKTSCKLGFQTNLDGRWMHVLGIDRVCWSRGLECNERLREGKRVDQHLDSQKPNNSPHLRRPSRETVRLKCA
jgi:hypothetical protein